MIKYIEFRKGNNYAFITIFPSGNLALSFNMITEHHRLMEDTNAQRYTYDEIKELLASIGYEPKKT